jgi:hypothetical protein
MYELRLPNPGCLFSDNLTERTESLSQSRPAKEGENNEATCPITGSLRSVSFLS